MFLYPILHFRNTYLIKHSVLNDQRTHCLDDVNTEGSGNVGVLAIQQPDAAVNPRKFY